MQRYIATSIQRRGSNISTIWDMVNDEVGFFLRSSSSFFRRWLTKTANQLSRRVSEAAVEMD
jgi:hypothetical protein